MKVKQNPDIDDRELEIVQYSPVCSFCVYQEDLKKCRAFREKDIPDEIWAGKNKHTEPYKGDHGIQFKRIKKK